MELCKSTRISKYLIAALAIVVAFSSWSQNKVDEQGRKQGAWVKTYPNSRAILYKGQFVDDEPVGTFTYYYPSTKVQAVIKHDAETKTSKGYFYHENGNLMTYGTYKNQLKDGVWYNYGPSGRISFTETYKNDQLHGKKTVYFVPSDPADKSEKVSRTMYYVNGQLDGEFREWFDFGGIRTEGQYVNNRRHGVWKAYHYTGNLMSLTRYKNGEKHGWCTAHDESGKELNKVYYFHNELKEGEELEKIMKQFKEKGLNPNG